MRFHGSVVALSLCGLCLAITAAAQTPSPAFDVVSIHPVSPSAQPAPRSVDFTPVQPHGGFRDSYTNAEQLIRFAYDVRPPGGQLSGVPKWAQTTAFSIQATTPASFPVLPDAENEAQIRLMMRTTLADRFHLQFHMEDRTEKVYRMELAKGGFKLAEVPPPMPPEQLGYTFGYGDRSGGGRLLGTKTNMARLALGLSVMVGKTVVDETGLPGYYTFDVKWTSDTPPPANDPPPTFGDVEFVTSLLPVLQSRFGLHLTNGAATVKALVIDRLNLPSEN